MKNIILLGIGLFLLNGCFDQRTPLTSEVKFIFPKNFQFKKLSSGRVVAVDCYGIFVTWQSSDSSCVNSDELNVSSPNLIAGLVQSGTNLSLLVPTGTKRKIEVIGATSINGTCPNFSTLTLNELESLDEILWLGSKTVDLVKAEETIEVEVRMADSKIITNCTGPIFNWEQTPVGKNIWDEAVWDQSTFGD